MLISIATIILAILAVKCFGGNFLGNVLAVIEYIGNLPFTVVVVGAVVIMISSWLLGKVFRKLLK